MVIRRLPVATPTRFLTFDDGPAAAGTPAVLDLLARYDASATFFVIAEEARRAPALLRRIVAGGHAIGNHSLDHRYRAYFSSARALRRWVDDAEKALADLLGEPTVGFRSPAGVRTPPLARALADLGLPHFHWDVRFYDAVWPWRRETALASVAATAPGSIILLHDRQRPWNLATFLATLEAYAAATRAAGWRLRPLPKRAGAASAVAIPDKGVGEDRA